MFSILKLMFTILLCVNVMRIDGGIYLHVFLVFLNFVASRRMRARGKEKMPLKAAYNTKKHYLTHSVREMKLGCVRKTSLTKLRA